MARKAASSDFNLSSALREIHAQNPDMKPKAMVEELMKKHPDQQIKLNTAKSTASAIRTKNGAAKTRRKGDTKASEAGRPHERTNGPGMYRLVETLQRAAALAEIIDIPEDKLPDVIRILSR